MELFLIPDICQQILSLCKLKTIFHLSLTCSTMNTAISNERLWEMMYRRDFLDLQHIDLSFTWRQSYSETYSAILATSKDLIDKLLLIDSKYINKTKLTRDLSRRLVLDISELHCTMHENYFCEGDNLYIDGDDFWNTCNDIACFIIALDGKPNSNPYLKINYDYDCCDHDKPFQNLLNKLGYTVQ